MGWHDAVDLVILAAAIYVALLWSREARAMRLTIGILGVEGAALVAQQFSLPFTVWVLHAGAVVAGVILVVLFQPELRHALNRLEVVVTRPERRGAIEQSLEVIAAAAFSLASAGRGALLVLRRHDSVSELLHGGVALGGHVSGEILEAIFRKVSPVHDGATVIDGDRITRVAALLPLSQRIHLPAHWGTRHRAAMGLAERSDAIVVVASEERREVTLMCDGAAQEVGHAEDLVHRLKELLPLQSSKKRSRRIVLRDAVLPGVAVLLAFVIGAASRLVTDDVVRARAAGIELTGMASDLRVAEQSITVVQLRLRASSRSLDAVEAVPMSVRGDLRGLREGVHAIVLLAPTSPWLQDIKVEAISPDRVTVRLVPAVPSGQAAR